YGFAAMFAMVGVFALGWVDKFVLAWLAGSRAVGLYQTAAQLSAAAPVLVLGALAAIVLPAAAHSMALGDDAHKRAILIASTKWAFFLVLPFVAVLMAAPGDFITSFYGGRYAEAAPVLRILALGQLANGATGLCGALLTLWGGQRLWAVLSLGAILFTVVADLFAIPRWSLMGAAVVTAGVNWLLYSAGIMLVAKKAGGLPYGTQFLVGPLAALVPAFATWTFSALRPTLHVGAEWILVVAAASGACYLGIVGLFARGNHDVLFWNWLVGTVRDERGP
ncbi:MAG: oligosaccharide flippase family protein, partial [Gammaproteobacteria bacterium]